MRCFNELILEYIMIRTIWQESEQQWYFVVADVIFALTKTSDAKSYTKKLRKYDNELRKVWGQFAILLYVKTNSGIQPMNCANLLGLIRITQSVKSPRAKRFVRWIADLDIDTSVKNQKIEITAKRMVEFRKLLNNPRIWLRKRNEFALANEKQVLIKRMNELELIFSILEKDDLRYKPLRSKKSSKTHKCLKSY